MRIENQGLSLWYGTSDAPGPGTAVPAGAEVPLTVGMSPPDASNKVNVHYRINGGSVTSLPAAWFRNTSHAQYFTARLPAFQEDHQVDWWVTACCAGKYVPAHAEAGTAVLTFRAARAATMASASQPPTRPGLTTRQSTPTTHLSPPAGDAEASNGDSADPTMVSHSDLTRTSARPPATSAAKLAGTTRDDEEDDGAESKGGNAPGAPARTTRNIDASAGPGQANSRAVLAPSRRRHRRPPNRWTPQSAPGNPLTKTTIPSSTE